MRFKIGILTTMVGFLVVLSFYLISSDSTGKNALSDLPAQAGQALVGPVSAADRFSSQTGYVLPISEPTYFPIRNPQVPEPVVQAKSFLIYDTRNGKIIFSKDPQRLLPVASLTKVLTAIVALENLPSDTPVTIKPEAVNVDGEGADFYRGEILYFKDLLRVMLVKSSNDAAYAIAKAVEEKTGADFPSLMNKKAARIGMASSHFLDSAGLSDDAHSTAEDLLRLVKYSKKSEGPAQAGLFAGETGIWNILGLKSADIYSADKKFSHHFDSTNQLLGVLPDIVGGKTGYTDGALGCIIIEQRLPQARSSLVAIVLGSPERFDDAQNLLKWAKTAFRWE